MAVCALATNAPISAGANPPRILRVPPRGLITFVAVKGGLTQPGIGAELIVEAFGAEGWRAAGLKNSEGDK